MKTQDETIYQLKVESFAMCAMSALNFYGVDGAIEHARKMAADSMDSNQMEDGEIYFMDMVGGGLE